MSSRFDYRDPGADPAYCAGLEHLEEDDPDTSPWHPGGTPWPDTQADEVSLCAWCGSLYHEADRAPYCSAQCSAEAELEGGA